MKNCCDPDIMHRSLPTKRMSYSGVGEALIDFVGIADLFVYYCHCVTFTYA